MHHRNTKLVILIIASVLLAALVLWLLLMPRETDHSEELISERDSAAQTEYAIQNMDKPTEPSATEKSESLANPTEAADLKNEADWTSESTAQTSPENTNGAAGLENKTDWTSESTAQTSPENTNGAADLENKTDWTSESTPQTAPENTNGEENGSMDTDDGAVDSTEPNVSECSDYERYISMSAEEQENFYHSFEGPEDFFDWYNTAREEYEESLGAVEIGSDTDVDLGNLIG